MKICYLSKTFYQLRGGIESYVNNMAHYLTYLGHDIYICASNNNKKFYLNNGDSIKMINIEGDDDIFTGSWRIDKVVPIFNLQWNRKVASAIQKKRREIDIVESPDWLYEGLFLSKKKTIPVVVRLHGHKTIANIYVFKYMRPDLYQRLLLAQEKRLLQNADLLTSVSNSYADLISKNWKINRKKIVTVYTGVDTTFFKPLPTQPVNTNTILYVGRIEEGKGIDTIAQAIPIVLKEYPEVKFLFIGGDTSDFRRNFPSYRQHLLKDILKNCAHKVQFIDPIPHEELRTYYQTSTMAVFPSLYEPLATTTLEAMACGCPVIASNVGGFPEIIDNNENGLLVNPQDYLGLAKAIVTLLKNSQLRDQFSHAGVNTINQKFSLAKIANYTLDIYSSVIKKHKLS